MRLAHRPARRPGRPPAAERGSAGAEVLPFCVLIFVFGTLLLVNAWGVIDAKFAVTSASREAARTYAESDAGHGGEAAARRAAEDAITAYGTRVGSLVAKASAVSAHEARLHEFVVQGGDVGRITIDPVTFDPTQPILRPTLRLEAAPLAQVLRLTLGDRATGEGLVDGSLLVTFNVAPPLRVLPLRGDLRARPGATLVLARFGADEATWLADQSTAAIDRIQAFCDAEGIDCHLRRAGGFWTATAPAQMGAWDGPIRAAEQVGRARYLEPLDAEALRARTGSPVIVGAVGLSGIPPGGILRIDGDSLRGGQVSTSIRRSVGAPIDRGQGPDHTNEHGSRAARHQAERRLDRGRISRACARARKGLRVPFAVDGAHELAPSVVLVRRLEAERVDGPRQ